MNIDNRSRPSQIPALICGIWFLLTSWMWAWGANVVFSFPVGILAWVFWRRARKAHPGSRLNKIVPGILLVGVAASIVAIFLFK